MKKPIPEFKSEEEEAEYWDKHSLLEHFTEAELLMEPVVAKRRKDKVLTIRLDSINWRRLQNMANEYMTGPSTLARVLITKALDKKIHS
jgi:hypothetical protein